MIKNKISLYTAVLAVLVVIIIVFSMTGENKDNRKLQAGSLSIDDTASVSMVKVTGQGFSYSITRDIKSWKINGNYNVDPVISDVMLALMNNVKIKRPVAKSELNEVVSYLEEDGILVDVYSGTEILKSFYVGGKRAENITYFMNREDKIPYVMYIPGYNNYIAGFFEMDESNWRDRTIFSSNWMGIKKIAVNYPNASEESFSLAYDKNFFRVEGTSSFDTTAVMEYIELFEYIQAERFLPKNEYQKYDSLLSANNPLFSIDLDDINPDNVKRVAFFENPFNKNNYIAKIRNSKSEEEIVLVHGKVVQILATKKSHFNKKE
jgi:hypothetical protein